MSVQIVTVLREGLVRAIQVGSEGVLLSNTSRNPYLLSFPLKDENDDRRVGGLLVRIQPDMDSAGSRIQKGHRIYVSLRRNPKPDDGHPSFLPVCSIFLPDEKIRHGLSGKLQRRLGVWFHKIWGRLLCYCDDPRWLAYSESVRRNTDWRKSSRNDAMFGARPH